MKPNVTKSYLSYKPTPSAAIYIGTCEQYPLVQGVQSWNPIYNDLSGPLTPFDREFQGRTKLIILSMNKFLQDALDQMVTESFGIAGDIGSEDTLTRGALLQASGLSFALWLQFSYFETELAPLNLPPGEMYFCCSLPQDGYETLGTRNRKTQLIIQADPAAMQLSTSVLGSGSTGTSTPRGLAISYNTYTRDPSYFSGLPSAS